MMCVNVWPGSRPTEPPPREHPDCLSLEPEHRARYEIVRRARLEGWSEARLDAVLPPLGVTPRGVVQLTQAGALAAAAAIVGRGEPLTYRAMMDETGVSRDRVWQVVGLLRRKGEWRHTVALESPGRPRTEPRPLTVAERPQQWQYDRAAIRALVAEHPTLGGRALHPLYVARTGHDCRRRPFQQALCKMGLGDAARHAYRDDVARALVADRPDQSRREYHRLYVARTGHSCRFWDWDRAMRRAGVFNRRPRLRKPHDLHAVRRILEESPGRPMAEYAAAYSLATGRKADTQCIRNLVKRLRRLNRGA